MKRTVTILVSLALILAIIIPGCYTVIMHPKSAADYRPSQTSDCVKCHSGYTQFPYGHYYAPYPEYWWEFADYGNYYAYPWWWDYYNSQLDYDDFAEAHDDKFNEYEMAPGPPPPPNILGHIPIDYYPIPSVIIYDAGGRDISPGTGSSGRPSSDADDARSKDPGDPSNKDVRQSAPPSRPDPVPENQTDTGKKEPAKKQDDGKKKPRRGGGM